MYYDNMSAFNITKNHVQHRKTKQIDIRHHFIRELVEQGVVELEYVPTLKQIVDILTKPLDSMRFEKLIQAFAVVFSKHFLYTSCLFCTYVMLYGINRMSHCLRILLM